MRVLVDTSVWSIALRRKPRDLNPAEQLICEELARLIHEGQAVLIGVVRQEILSGIRDASTFARIRVHLRLLDDEVPTIDDYEQAAEFNNTCRGAGIAGSTVDFLLCGMAHRRGLSIFTTDLDFARYARHVPLKLHEPPAE